MDRLYVRGKVKHSRPPVLEDMCESNHTPLKTTCKGRCFCFQGGAFSRRKREVFCQMKGGVGLWEVLLN